MDKYEQRAWSNYCMGEDDRCASLKEATNRALDIAEIKMEDMLADVEFMYPGIEWGNHYKNLLGRWKAIRGMISLGEKMGCDMSAERARFNRLMVPNAPRPK